MSVKELSPVGDILFYGCVYTGRMKVETSRKGNDALLKRLLKEKNQGVKIDLGCGANKIPDFIGVDNRALPGVDIVCDLEKFPWPIPDECASTVTCSHVLEHINKAKLDVHFTQLIKLLLKKKTITGGEVKEFIGDIDFESTFIRFMDEAWRILKPGGDFAIAVPYAGTVGFYQDPTHINPLTQATFYYFDPFHASDLYRIYRPKPWEILDIFWDTEAIMEIHLRKRREDKSFTKHVSLSRPRGQAYINDSKK